MATLKNKSLKRDLSTQAEENTTVTKGKFSDRTTLKQGTPNDHSRKNVSNSGAPVVGVSIGSTLNMGDYESLRADCWLTDEVHENETIEQAYERVTHIVSETLSQIVDSYK